jgi:hypothetical protein
MSKFSFYEIYDDAVNGVVDGNRRDWRKYFGVGDRTVHFKININSRNPLKYDIVPLFTKKVGNKKPQLGEKKKALDMVRGGCDPILINDNMQYVFGVNKKGKTCAAEYHQKYVALLRTLCLNVPSTLNLAFLEWINNVDKQSVLEEMKSKSKVNLSDEELAELCVEFYVDDQNLAFTSNNFAFWQDYYLSRIESSEGVCGFTGDRTQVITSFIPSKIKGVPGGQSTGSSLISYNCSYSTAYNRNNGLNAPIGVEAALTTYQFINYLLSHPNHHHKIKGTNKVVLFWSDRGITINQDIVFNDCPLDDPLATLDMLLCYSDTGKVCYYKDLENPQQKIRFLTLTGNAGRVAISSSDLVEIPTLIANYKRFLDCQVDLPKRFTPWQIREISMATDIPRLNLAFTNAILFGTPLPAEFARAVVRKICLDGRVGQRELIALRYYTKLKEDKGMNKLDSGLIEYARVVGKISYCIGIAQSIHQNRGSNSKLPSTNVVKKNLASLDTNKSGVFPILLRDANKIYFNYDVIPDHQKPLLGKCEKLFLLYLKEWTQFQDSEYVYTRFNGDVQNFFYMGYYYAQNEYCTKSEKSKQDSEESNQDSDQD